MILVGSKNSHKLLEVRAILDPLGIRAVIAVNLPEVEEDDAAGGDDDDDEDVPEPEIITLPEGRGVARVIATFSEPGQYLMLARVDNWSATDSSSGSQCCWTNGYVRVNVTP